MPNPVSIRIELVGVGFDNAVVEFVSDPVAIEVGVSIEVRADWTRQRTER